MHTGSFTTAVRYLFPLLAVAVAVGKCLSVSACHIDTDPAAFSAIGLHLLKGKTLYKDVWDSKPPGIFILHQFALWLFGVQLSSLKIIAVIFACINGFSAYTLFKTICKQALTALLCCLVYLSLFYSYTLYNSGNFTEEYAAVFLLSGFTLFYHVFNNPEAKSWLYVASGILAGFSFWFKEPFILPMGMVVIYQSVCLVRNQQKKAAVWLLSGYVMASLLMIFYLLQQGIFNDFTGYLQYNMAYSEYESDGIDLWQKIRKSITILQGFSFPGMLILKILALAGLISCCWPAFQKRHHFLPVLAVFWFLADTVGASLSGYGYNHYYLQLVWSYVLISVLGFQALQQALEWLLQKIRVPLPERYLSAGIVILFFTCIELYDIDIRRSVSSMSFHMERPCSQNAITKYLHTHAKDTDRLFVESSDACRYYVENNMIADVKYPDPSFFFFMVKTPHYDGHTQAVYMLKQLQKNPPEYLISARYFHEFTWISGAGDWFRSEYHVVDSAADQTTGMQYLWRRN